MKRVIVVTLVLILVGALVFAIDAIPFLRGGYGWQWPYVPVALIRLLPLVIAVGVSLGVSALLLRARLRWQMLWSLVSVPVLTIAALAARQDDPGQALILRTLSPLTTGVHAAAAAIDWDDPAWWEWSDVMVDFEGRIAHVNLAPPALPLVYAGAVAVLERLPTVTETLAAPILTAQCHNYALLDYTPAEWAAAWPGVLMPLWAGLGVIPLVALARRLSGGHDRAARIAALLYPLVPSLLIFTPTWNTIYPLFSLTALWLLDHGLNRVGRSRYAWIFMAGIVTGLCVFVNFAFVPLGLLFGVYALAHWHGVDRPAGRTFLLTVTAGAVCAAGVALPWVAYGLLTGSWPWELLSASMGMHLELERDYLPWIWLHGWDWALWTGLPVIALWLFAAGRGLRAAEGRLSASLLLTLLILLLSNFARGETGRVWTLFVPFVVIAAAGVLARMPRARTVLALAGVAQAAWLIAVVAVIDAVAVDLTAPPAAPTPFEDLRPVDAGFADQFTLVSWDAVPEDSGFSLRLNWRAEAAMFTPYWLSALLVDPSGSAVGQAHVWQPDATRYPTTCWTPGTLLGDSITIAVSDDAPAGDYWISLAAFPDDAGLNRLPVQVPGSAPSDQVGLGPVTLSP